MGTFDLFVACEDEWTQADKARGHARHERRDECCSEGAVGALFLPFAGSASAFPDPLPRGPALRVVREVLSLCEVLARLSEISRPGDRTPQCLGGVGGFCDPPGLLAQTAQPTAARVVFRQGFHEFAELVDALLDLC